MQICFNIVLTSALEVVASLRREYNKRTRDVGLCEQEQCDRRGLSIKRRTVEGMSSDASNKRDHCVCAQRAVKCIRTWVAGQARGGCGGECVQPSTCSRSITRACFCARR